MSKHTLFSVKLIVGILISVLMLFPIYLMLVSSIKPTTEVFDLKLIPRTVTSEGFQVAVRENFLVYFKNSLFVSLTVTVVALAFHAMAGYALARLHFPGRNLIFLSIISTLMIPFSVIMIPLFVMMKQFGWLNTYAGLIIPAIPHAYGIFLFRQFFLTLPKELEEAAKIDGCSLFGIFVRIVLPLSKPICVTLAVAFFVANWNNYLWPLIVSQKQNMWVLQIGLANFIGRQDTPWNAVMASGAITVLPVIVIFFFLQNQLVEGIKMSGLK